MFWPIKLNKRLSSRRQINIRGVEDGILLMPDNRYCSVLSVSSLNFELKSEAEQDILIENYQAFLNSLPGPIQILVRTRELDIDKYLDRFKQLAAVETELVYKEQITSYSAFVASLIKSSKILGRHFFIIIPFAASADTTIGEVRQRLELYSELIARHLGRLDLRCQKLSSLEVLELFYSLYSPLQSKLQPLKALSLTKMRRAAL